MARVAVKQPEPPAKQVPTEVIAEALVAISDGVAKLRRGSLNDKALTLLIQHACPSADRPSAKTINTVLNAVEELKREYLRKPAAK